MCVERPIRMCWMHRRTRLPKSSTARSTSSTGRLLLTLEPSSVLGGIVSPPFDLGRGGPGGWWILDEPQLHLGEDIVVPDIAGWRRERMPVFPDTAYTTLAPDWVCEVLSPDDAQVGPGRQERGVRPGRRRIPMVRRPDRPLTGSEGAARHASGWRLPRCMTMRPFR